ncbi:MAG TPA: hypothetical protein VFZ35_02585 [Sphingomicrobium sp.]
MRHDPNRAGSDTGQLPRRDLLAIFAYLNRAAPRSVDGVDCGPEMHLDRLVAAARMQ